MNILVLGAEGYVGRYLCSSLPGQIFKASRSIDSDLTFDASEIDASVNRIIDFVRESDISVVINAVAMANVDECQEKTSKCKLINFEFVRLLTDQLKAFEGVHFVHFSTNAVYGGNDYPFSESSEKYPVNIYGCHKKMADDYITNSGLVSYTILRPITIIGPRLNKDRHNPLSFIVDMLKAGNKIKLVDDNVVNYLYINDFIRCIRLVIEKKYYGEFNISGDVSESRYYFGIRIARTMNLEPEMCVEMARSDEFPTIAPRAYNTSFDNSKMKSILGVTPTDLDEVLLKVINFDNE